MSAHTISRSDAASAFAVVRESASGGAAISDTTTVQSDMLIARAYFTVPSGCTYSLKLHLSSGDEYVLAAGTATATNYTFAVAAGTPVPAGSSVIFTTGSTAGNKMYTISYEWR